MKELIHWLKKIEEKAADLYAGAAETFTQDEELTNFLTGLAEDENLHYHIMGSAADYLLTEGIDKRSDILLDIETKDNLEKPFEENLKMLSEGTLTVESLINCIAKTELSEWNNIFLYIVNILIGYSKFFQFSASIIQAHQQKIKTFLEYKYADKSMIQKFQDMPMIWNKHILVVDDNLVMRELLKAFFEGSANVDIAEDGAVGFKKLQGSFYDIIISDIDMPGMDGIQLYREISKKDPIIANNFIFCTGFISEENENFLKEKNLQFIIKPFSFAEIKKKVDNILLKALNQTAAFDI